MLEIGNKTKRHLTLKDSFFSCFISKPCVTLQFINAEDICGFSSGGFLIGSDLLRSERGLHFAERLEEVCVSDD